MSAETTGGSVYTIAWEIDEASYREATDKLDGFTQAKREADQAAANATQSARYGTVPSGGVRYPDGTRQEAGRIYLPGGQSVSVPTKSSANAQQDQELAAVLRQRIQAERVYTRALEQEARLQGQEQRQQVRDTNRNFTDRMRQADQEDAKKKADADFEQSFRGYLDRSAGDISQRQAGSQADELRRSARNQAAGLGPGVHFEPMAESTEQSKRIDAEIQQQRATWQGRLGRALGRRTETETEVAKENEHLRKQYQAAGNAAEHAAAHGAEHSFASRLSNAAGWMPGSGSLYQMQMMLGEMGLGLSAGMIAGITGVGVLGLGAMGVADAVAQRTQAGEVVGAITGGKVNPALDQKYGDTVGIIAQSFNKSRPEGMKLLSSASALGVTDPTALLNSVRFGLALGQQGQVNPDQSAALYQTLTARSGGDANTATAQLLKLNAAIKTLGVSPQAAINDVTALANQLTPGADISQLAMFTQLGAQYGMTGAQAGGGVVGATGSQRVGLEALLGYSGNAGDQQFMTMQRSNPLALFRQLQGRVQGMEAQGMSTSVAESMLSGFGVIPQGVNPDDYMRMLDTANISDQQVQAFLGNVGKTDTSQKAIDDYLKNEAGLKQQGLQPQDQFGGFLRAVQQSAATTWNTPMRDFTPGNIPLISGWAGASIDAVTVPFQLGSDFLQRLAGTFGTSGVTATVPGSAAAGSNVATVNIVISDQSGRVLDARTTSVGMTTTTTTATPQAPLPPNMQPVSSNTPGSNTLAGQHSYGSR